MPKPGYKQQLEKAVQQLRDPFRFRIFVTLVALSVAYFAIYSPINGEIEKEKRKLSQEQNLAELCRDVEFLRAQMALCEHRLVKNSDVNEWIEYVLNGVRELPVTLINLDSGGERKVGLYTAIVLRLEVSGEMQDMDALLQWLESNDRLFRIDIMNLAPDRKNGDHRRMQLTLLGLKG